MTETRKKIERKLKGIVVSDKMDKTIVVRVDRYRRHRKYLKQYRVSKRYKAHDPKNAAKIGDTVTIVAARPYSRDVRWLLLSSVAVTGDKS